MASVPARTCEAPPSVPELVITASEWEAMLIEDPQASPDWKEALPYGSWRWRLPGAGDAERPRLAAPSGGWAPRGRDPVESGS